MLKQLYYIVPAMLCCYLNTAAQQAERDTTSRESLNEVVVTATRTSRSVIMNKKILTLTCLLLLAGLSQAQQRIVSLNGAVEYIAARLKRLLKYPDGSTLWTRRLTCT